MMSGVLGFPRNRNRRPLRRQPRNPSRPLRRHGSAPGRLTATVRPVSGLPATTRSPRSSPRGSRQKAGDRRSTVHNLCYVHVLVNMANSVNTRLGSAGVGLERSMLEKLVQILGDVGWLGDVRLQAPPRSTPDEADAIVHVRGTKGRDVELRVHVKKELRPGAFSAWIKPHTLADAKSASILAMPFVSSRIADLCKQAGWSWYDLAGNCRIDVPGLLHVERVGIPPIKRPPRASANLSTIAAARVLRALLSPAHAAHVWTQRSLQASTSWNQVDGKEVSLGLVNKVIRHLRDEGFITDADGIRVRDPGGLLAAWNKAYRFDLHARHGYFSLLKSRELQDALYRLGAEAGGLVVYAGFSAAERQAPHVRQPKTWLYVSHTFLDAFLRQTKAKEVDSGENIVVLVPADIGVFLSFDAESHVGSQVLGCTDPVQTYVDLTHSGGRGEEAAQALLEQKILPAWRAVAPA